jgi:enolase
MRIEETELSPEEWINRLVSWCNSYPILSVEDPLHEDDWHNWQRITSLLGGERQILGDDLFATNLGRLDRGVLERAANAVLIKPNQAGTISRTKQVIRTAKSAGFGTVVSARSGDTEDYWLADLAVGWHAGQIKVGSTHRSERTSKWNRLLEIEAELGSKAAFGYAAFHP